MKYLFVLLSLGLFGCTIHVTDDRLNLNNLAKKLQLLDKTDELIVEKLVELQKKGYLDKPSEVPSVSPTPKKK